MKNEQVLKLIDGVFSPQAAEKVLTTLINSKINYHNLEDFSNHIRFNKDIAHSKKRIAELNEEKEKIKNLLEYATANSLDVVVNSLVEISLKT